MVLGFKKQFVAPILAGTKIHTLREDLSGRWKAGMLIQMATGVSTKNYNCFMNSQCLSTQKVEIIRKSDYLNETVVKVDGRELNMDEVKQLALNDGFDCLASFWLWFSDGFSGNIIHWTDLRY